MNNVIFFMFKKILLESIQYNKQQYTPRNVILIENDNEIIIKTKKEINNLIANFISY